MDVQIRHFELSDLPRLQEITVEAFEGVSIEHNIEQQFGPIRGHDWRWRKARHVEQDAQRHPEGILVALHDGQVVGYVSTWLDREAGIGHIPNLSITAWVRGKGLGRRLLNEALDYFRVQGMSHAKIETLDQNPVGQSLYPSLGFQEVARQIHYVMQLDRHDSSDA
jgi:ribosomal protein S18 acetylase RimI-like enzyme